MSELQHIGIEAVVSGDPILPTEFIQALQEGLPKEWWDKENDVWHLRALMPKTWTRKRIEDLEEQIANLQEKNGNQFNQIEAYQKNVKSLIAQKEDQQRVIRKLYDDKDGLLVDVLELKKRLDDSLVEWEQMKEEREVWKRRAESKAPGVWTRNESVAEMIGKVLAAIKSYGWDVGWGDDDDLTELEDHAANLQGEANELLEKLDTIRTAR